MAATQTDVSAAGGATTPWKGWGRHCLRKARCRLRYEATQGTTGEVSGRVGDRAGQGWAGQGRAWRPEGQDGAWRHGEPREERRGGRAQVP